MGPHLQSESRQAFFSGFGNLSFGGRPTTLQQALQQALQAVNLLKGWQPHDGRGCYRILSDTSIRLITSFQTILLALFTDAIAPEFWSTSDPHVRKGSGACLRFTLLCCQ